MEEDTKAKQDYLYTQIIDKNYDPEQFQEYIQEIKGLSLDLYTLAQLTAIVQSFRKGQKYQSSASEQPSLPESLPSFLQRSGLSQEAQSKLNQGQPSSAGKVEALVGSAGKAGALASPLYQSSNSSNNAYHQFVLKQSVSNLYTRIYQKKERVRIRIRSYAKLQQESFFGSTYVSYLVETRDLGWTVRRRFSDFHWLQSKISQLFPGFPVPPIPKKTAMRSFDDGHLQERMNFFESYLNKLLNIPEICSQSIFQQFLRIVSEQEFSSCKERLELALRDRGNKVVTLKGQDLIDKTQYKLQLREYQFFKKSKELLHSLNFSIGSLQQLLKQTTHKAFEVSSIFSELQEHLGPGEIRGAGVLQVMGDFVSELGYKLEREHSFIQKQLQNYWCYEEKYLENIVSFMSRISKDHYDMLNKYKSMASFEVDPDAELKTHSPHSRIFNQYQQARENYRLRLSFLRSEVTRFQQNDLLLAAKEWVNSLQSYMGGVRDLMISGVDQLTKAQCVAEGKKLIEVEYILKKGGDKK